MIRGRQDQLRYHKGSVSPWQELHTNETIHRYLLPAKGVRYVALNDSIDSKKGESEIAPFLNILNEMHAKGEGCAHTRFQNGAYVGAYAPIGYRKDPAQKGHLIPDEETKWIVEKIFMLAVSRKKWYRADEKNPDEYVMPNYPCDSRDVFETLYGLL